MEEIQNHEARANNFNNVKSKLESTLDDLEDELQMEKKAKSQNEKTRRKLEGDLKRCLEVIDEKEKDNSSIKQSLMKREKELAHLVTKLEDEQNVIIRNMKQIKDLGGRIEELEEELETERQVRLKSESHRSLLNQELEDMNDKMKEIQDSLQAKEEAVKRKDKELGKQRKDLTDEYKILEDQMEHMKRKKEKHVLDLSEKLQSHEEMISRLTKEKNDLLEDNDMMKNLANEKQREICSGEKKYKMLVNQLNICELEIQKKSKELQELDNSKKIITEQNQELLSTFEEKELQAKMNFQKW